MPVFHEEQNREEADLPLRHSTHRDQELRCACIPTYKCGIWRVTLKLSVILFCACNATTQKQGDRRFGSSREPIC